MSHAPLAMGPGWEANKWALEAARDLAIMEAGWKRNVCKYHGKAYDRYRAYHSAAQHFESELRYWRERVAADVAAWFDGSAFK